MFRVLARATILLAVAPSMPVSWWPGARTLPESVLRRLPKAGVGVVERDLRTTRYPSSVRLVAIPVDGGRAVPHRESMTITKPDPTDMMAPWGEPAVPFAGVTVSTCRVPQEWLRPATRTRTFALPVSLMLPTPISGGATSLEPRTASPETRAAAMAPPRQPRAHPPARAAIRQHGQYGRFRRAATLALGLLLSLVAVEAAARSARR